MANGNYRIAIVLGINTVAAVAATPIEEGAIQVVDLQIAPVQGMARGEVKNLEQASASIKAAIEPLQERLGITITEAYAGISGEHIRCVKYPYHVFIGGDGEILSEDVQKLRDNMANISAPEGETIIQIIPQHYLIDGEENEQPVGAFGRKLEGLFHIILADSTAVTRTKRALTRAGVRTKGIYLNALAAAEAVTTQEERHEGVAVVNLGGGTTEVAIYYRDTLRHIAIIPMGGNVINRDIRAYGILERHIEKLKVTYGCALHTEVTNDKLIQTPGLNARSTNDISIKNLASIIEARMLDIFDIVHKEIENSGFADKLAGGVVLTGGSAQLPAIDKLARRHMGIETRIAAPEVATTLESVEGHEAITPAYTTAIGLIFMGIAATKRPIRRTPQAAGAGVGAAAPRPYAAPIEEPIGATATTSSFEEEYEEPIADHEALPDTPLTSPYEEPAQPKAGWLKKLKGWTEKVFDSGEIGDEDTDI